MDSPGVVLVTLHRQGQALMRLEPGAHHDLVRACEAQLTGADGILRLAVQDSLIATLRDTELTLEIHYPAPRRFTLDMGGRTLELSRLLIPLSGEYAGPVTTLFYGTEDHWSAGPLRNSRGTEALQALIPPDRPL